MDKIQINISSPVLLKLKALGKKWDTNTSDIIRIAIERLLNQIPEVSLSGNNQSAGLKTFDLGKIKVKAQDMREILSSR